MRSLCLIVGHNYRTIKEDNNIWIRECKDCGKILTIRLR